MLKIYGNIYVGMTAFFGWAGETDDPQNAALFGLTLLNTANIVTGFLIFRYFGFVIVLSYFLNLIVCGILPFLINYYLFSHKMRGKKYMKYILRENKINVAIRSFVVYISLTFLLFVTAGLLNVEDW